MVGYAAVDGDAQFRNDMAEYLTCGDEEDIVDLYGESTYALVVLVLWVRLDAVADTRIEQLRMVR